MTVQSHILITGANRGIGLELVKQYLSKGGWVVHAACRTPDKADDLRELQKQHPEQLILCQLDVSSKESIDALVQSLQGQAIDCLINGAGIYTDKFQSLWDLDYDQWAETFAINTMAPLRVSTALMPNLEKAPTPKIITLSSQMGSMLKPMPGSVAYRSSKAAVNKVMQVLADEVKPRGVIVVPMHPGWVRTDMGGEDGDISTSESARGIISVIDSLTIDQTGQFFKWNGEQHPW